MKNNKITYHSLKYEMLNLLANGYIPFFGIVFPIFMMLLISYAVGKDVPADFTQLVMTKIMVTMMMIVPLAITFLGHSSIYSEELEKQIPQRLDMFGVTLRSQLISKMIVQFILLTFAMGLNYAVGFMTLDVYTPNAGDFLLVNLYFYLLAVSLFILGHGIANWIRRHAPAFGLAMALYFSFMVLGGVMGIEVDDFPPVMESIAKIFPFYYVQSLFVKVWMGKEVSIMPAVQSLIFFLALALLVFFTSNLFHKRHRIGFGQRKEVTR
ncbi:MAG: ABC transporter permease [Fastidiosipilaceae bacterium]|jgi:ABC-2 type transport system permease protein|nr:ABC transporter permease [Clostridiaceae bacterium]